MLMVSLALGGCAELSYYGHAAAGQLDVLAKRRPIAEVLADPDTAPERRDKLTRVLAMREFAVQQLGLPDTPSFRSFADLQRPHVLWTVYATAQLGLAPKQWCVPLLGCTSYRAFFAEAPAERLAAQLRAAGWDVYIAVSPAYSTAGWFDDPVYHTILAYPEAELAGILFHELAHERVYVPNETRFNESFAMAVQLEGARRWLAVAGRGADFEAYLKRRQRDERFMALLLEYRDRLERLYAATIDDEGKRANKVRILAELRRAYGRLRRGWDGYAGYDHWFRGTLNNATLAPAATYYQLVPAFQTLLQRYEHDLPRFYAAVDALASLAPGPREARLQALLAAAAPLSGVAP